MSTTPGVFWPPGRWPWAAAGRKCSALLGPPMREIGDSLVYHLEDRGYPVRLRLYFREGLLADAYCYRGDL